MAAAAPFSVEFDTNTGRVRVVGGTPEEAAAFLEAYQALRKPVSTKRPPALNKGSEDSSPPPPPPTPVDTVAPEDKSFSSLAQALSGTKLPPSKPLSKRQRQRQRQKEARERAEIAATQASETSAAAAAKVLDEPTGSSPEEEFKVVRSKQTVRKDRAAKKLGCGPGCIANLPTKKCLVPGCSEFSHPNFTKCKSHATWCLLGECQESVPPAFTTCVTHIDQCPCPGCENAKDDKAWACPQCTAPDWRSD
jgi:hypothetical protein